MRAASRASSAAKIAGSAAGYSNVVYVDFAYGLGCAIMIAADAQKFFTLRLRRGLITDGMHRYVRHPNYLGEIMIYGSFAMMIWHWLPALVLAWVWLGLFAVNMIMKEASMSRYPEWPSYKKRTWWLIPFVL